MPPTSCDGQLRTRRHLLGDFRCRLCGDWPFATRRGQLLILQRAHALRKTEEANEARGVALLIHVILAERDEPCVVERVLARAAGDGNSALVQLERYGTGDALLRDSYKGVVGLALGSPPSSLVHEIRIAGRDQILRGERATIEHELLE